MKRHTFNLFILFPVLFPSICVAEPSSEVLELMNEPVSLMERGVINLEKSLTSLANFKSVQEVNPFLEHYNYEWTKDGRINPNVQYSWDDNQLLINIYLQSEEQDKWEGLCEGMMSFLKGLYAPAEGSDDPTVGEFFLPYRGLHYDNFTEKELQRARHIDSITVISIVVERRDNPHDFVQCSSPLNSDNIEMQVFPPD